MDERASYIPGIPSIRVVDLPVVKVGTGERVLERAIESMNKLRKAQYLLFTSVQELEPHVLNVLKSEFHLPVYPVGPVIPYFSEIPPKSNEESDRIFQWLGAQPRNSVLYVSFGSFLPIPEAQLAEISAGLRDSGVRYLWVKRWGALCNGGGDDDDGDERGIAVAWCDQLKVLGHGAVGGFWTHCGWNSSLEGAYAGVPMLTFPIGWDQAPNSKIIVEDWKVGTRVRKTAMGLGDTVSSEFVTRDEIARIVKGFMDLEREEGKEMRRRAREVGEMCQCAIGVGGSSETNLSAFVRDITKDR